MRFSTKKGVLTVIVAAIAILCTAGGARADFELQLSDGTTTTTIVDNGTGDGNSTTGLITFSGSVGGFSVNLTAGASKPVIGLPNDAEMDLNDLTITAGSTGGTLTIALADTGFSSPTGSSPLETLSTAFGGTLPTSGSPSITPKAG